MATFTRFEEIEAWQEARILTTMVYAATRYPPFKRDAALLHQIRRSVISVMSNIAEGYERHRRAEFIQFLSIAKGSGGELKAQLYIALDIGYLSHDQFQQLWEQADRVTRLIYGLIRYLKHVTENGHNSG